MRCALLFCALVGLVAAGGQVLTLNQDARNKIVERHNWYRGHYPRATDNMHMMHWDFELAKHAAAYAKGCKFQHSTSQARKGTCGYSYVGENLAAGSAGSAKYELPQAVTTYTEMWADERHNFDFNTGKCRKGACGHYTQMVWHSSLAVGCALVKCPKGTIFGMASTYFVCQYGPGGNMYGELPAHAAGSGACKSKPCGEMGACLATGGNYKCECMAGYSSAGGVGPCKKGNNNQNACTGVKCSGKGACYLSGGNAKCRCEAGWTGTKCEKQVNGCATNPCVHGTCSTVAVTSKTPGGYKCRCAAHWHGASCSEADDPCSPNPCKNGGSCKKDGVHFKCTCKTGWKGIDCTDSGSGKGKGSGKPPSPSGTKGSKPPSSSTFIGAMWKMISSKRASARKPRLGWSNSMVKEAQRKCTCRPTSDTRGPIYSSSVRLCTSRVPSARYASAVVNWWAKQSYGKWMYKSGISYAGCSVRSSPCSGKCGRGKKFITVVCAYTTSSGETMSRVSTDDPMDFGRVGAENDTPTFEIDESNIGTIVTAGAIAAALIAVVVAVVVLRRRSTDGGAEYSEMEEAL